MMSTNNIAVLLFTIALIVGAIIYLDSSKTALPTSAQPLDFSLGSSSTTQSISMEAMTKSSDEVRAEKAKRYPMAKEIVSPTGFINTPENKPIAIQSLLGKKVILLDIWTYSCINCQRTLPYLNSWYEKYKDKGLEIIGLHVPEFEFEKNYQNVSTAVKKFGIKYPVVLDNDSHTARAYGMRYWPEEYLIDIDGFIVHKSIGEGRYDEKESKIQELLNERMKLIGEKDGVNVPVSKIDTAAMPQTASPEIYFGAARNEYLSNGFSGKAGDQNFSLPSSFETNRLYLGGLWTMNPEYAENKTAKASIVFRYRSKEVYIVASSPLGVKLKVYNDGVLVADKRGADVAPDGSVLIKEDRLYKLIKNPSLEEHTLKIEIEEEGLRVYTFTFG